MAELFNNFASAIIHSAAFPQYPVRSVGRRFDSTCGTAPPCAIFDGGFERFQLAGLALLCLKNETREESERDLKALISASVNDEREKARRERLLQHLLSTDKAEPIELAKYSLERARSIIQTGSDRER
jgi:hypothetical protein